MPAPPKPPTLPKGQSTPFVGTLVGESTSREFRLALAQESVREQDIIAVDAEFKSTEGFDRPTSIRIWAKVQRIERINPLFPHEAGHELAFTGLAPENTVLSLSREMVTAVCQVLGAERKEDADTGRLDQLRYPAQPASQAYRPTAEDVARVVIGDLQKNRDRALDLATLSNRSEISVLVDGHDVVTRHLAILAMTGAGKSWTARRLIEEIARKNYPLVIFDPHGDYTGLVDVPTLQSQVKRYYATFPVFDQGTEDVAAVVDSLGYTLTDTMRGMFADLFAFAKKFIQADLAEMKIRAQWLAEILDNPKIVEFGIKPDMWLLVNLAGAVEIISQEEGQPRFSQLQDFGWEERLTKKNSSTFEGIKKRCRSAAIALQRMEKTNQIVAKEAQPLPSKRSDLVQYGQISVVSLAGYTSDFQATIYSLIVEDIFEQRIQEELKLPVLFVLEEAHNFAPAQPSTAAEKRAIQTTRQVAQEGRKFNIGQVLISQRPSRLDETTLSQCNSFIIMRMVNPADQAFVRRVIETLGEEETKLLPDLDVGEALLSGQFINFPVLVRIKPPAARGEREEADAFASLKHTWEQMMRDSHTKSTSSSAASTNRSAGHRPKNN